jgi:hypothetical protein
LQIFAVAGEQFIVLGTDIILSDRYGQFYTGMFKPGNFFGYSHVNPLL